jgi:hypothetical protein
MGIQSRRLGQRVLFYLISSFFCPLIIPSLVFAAGPIAAWGDNLYGQCNVPEPETRFIAISSGWSHNLAIVRYCDYILVGDLNDDCTVDFCDLAEICSNQPGDIYDLSEMCSNWLIDCVAEPGNPQCVPK